jgi:single-strand DNA-binding protein
MNFNKVILGGYLTRDPELRYTPKGTALCSFTIASNRKFKLESGEQKEEVTFVNCTAWGNRGAYVGQYLRKGHPLLIEGRLKLNQWQDKQSGQKHSQLKVEVENVMNFRRTSEEGGKAADDTAADTKAADDTAADTKAADDTVDDDVPF